MTFDILMPSYNYGRFIGSAIRSVQLQESGARLIVQDAGSTDETIDVIREFDWDGVDLLVESDAGQSDALNRAVVRASSKYVGWLNSDEFYLPGALSAVSHVFEANPQVGVVFGDCAFVDETGRLIRLVPGHRFSDSILRNYGCFISSCATFVRRSELENPVWDESLRRSMDWDLWLKLAQKTRFHYLPVPLAAYRIHGGQVTNTPEAEESEEFTRLFEKHSIDRGVSPRLLPKFGHGLSKLLSGSYIRQFRASSFRGKHIEWSATASGSGHSAHDLVASTSSK